MRNWSRLGRAALGMIALATACETPKTAEKDDAKEDSSGKKSKKKGDEPKASSDKPAAAPTSARSAPSPTPAGPFAVSVPAGELDGVWTGAYRMQRLEGDTGKDYLEATELCRGQGMFLCSETQWLRGCAAEARVGQTATWTASWSDDSVVVRGGSESAGKCTDRTTAARADKSPTRAGLCCERAIGIKAAAKDASFREAVHADQLRFETALNAQDMTALDGIYGAGVFMEGKVENVLSHDKAMAAQKAWFAANPKQWTLYDVCQAGVGNIICPVPAGKSIECPGVAIECDMVSVLGDKVSVVKQRVGWWKGDEPGDKNKVWDIRHLKRDSKP